MRTTMRVLMMIVAGLALMPGPPAMAEGGGELDGFVIGHVPGNVGSSVSDFAYEPDDNLRFTSRVWEREVEGGHSVDLTVIVMRGDRLSSSAELRSFMAEYHERDPASWTDTRISGLSGFKDSRMAFWLVERGVAVSVSLDTGRFPASELLTVAGSIRKS